MKAGLTRLKGLMDRVSGRLPVSVSLREPSFLDAPTLKPGATAALPSMQCFHDVAIEPASSMTFVFACGGPDWPDFDQQVDARQCRDGRPADRRPVPADGPVEKIDEPCVWGGQIFRHFGHTIAEFSARLLQSKIEHPDARFLFLLPPDQKEGYVPSYFWDVLSWYGIGRDQVLIVRDRRFLARELWVAAQAEQLLKRGPVPGYIDVLTEHSKKLLGDPEKRGVAYVTRSALYPGHGRHAGEGYICELLAQLGVTIIEPENLGVAKQLNAYASAKHLIFSEGSAMHGRQLMGYQAQDITILNRRRGFRTAEAFLAPRCDRLTYVEDIKGQLSVHMENGAVRHQHALAIFDEAALIETLAGNGLDLTSLWDQAAYEAAVEKDTLAWARASFKRDRKVPYDQSIPHLTETLTELDLQSLTPRILEIAEKART